MTIQSRYGIIGIVGNREQGKTTFMIRHLIREMQLKSNYNRAACNIRVRFPGIEYIDSYEGLRNLTAENPKGTPTMIVGLDQIHKYMDARRSMSKKNVDFSQLIIESRQHGFDLIYTTWAMSSIDPRLRKFTELWILAQRTRMGFEYTFTDPNQGIILGTKTLTYQNAEWVWKHFETTELVNDIEVQ